MSVSTRYDKERTFSYASLALDYMIGLSNIMAGYDEERSFGTDIFAGPVCSFGLNGEVRTWDWKEGHVCITRCRTALTYTPNLSSVFIPATL